MRTPWQRTRPLDPGNSSAKQPGGDAIRCYSAIVAEVEQGETRILCAGGRLLGHYLRVPQLTSQQELPLANWSAGGSAETTDLTAGQRKIAQRIANDLVALGVGFAAIDLIGDHLLEVNIANPGGLARLAELEGLSTDSTTIDRCSARVVAALEGLWEDAL